MLHRCGNNSTSFSILFPMPGKQPMEEGISTNHTHPSSSVDCTLSLGTPSTRHNPSASSSPTPIQRSSCTPSFCWDIISQSNKHAVASSRLATAPTGNSSNLGGDPLHLARRCANCDTTSTPLWRNGPRGPKSLCNACGIRYKKEERRAAASSASPSTIPVNEAMGYSFQPKQQQQHPWSCNPSTGTKSTYEEFGMGRDQMVVERPSWCQNVEDNNTEVPYLSWRLNVGPPHFPVTDRPSVFQYQL